MNYQNYQNYQNSMLLTSLMIWRKNEKLDIKRQLFLFFMIIIFTQKFSLANKTLKNCFLRKYTPLVDDKFLLPED